MRPGREPAAETRANSGSGIGQQAESGSQKAERYKKVAVTWRKSRRPSADLSELSRKALPARAGAEEREMVGVYLTFRRHAGRGRNG